MCYFSECLQFKRAVNIYFLLISLGFTGHKYSANYGDVHNLIRGTSDFRGIFGCDQLVR